jgi:hypothetical protein
MSAMKFWIFDPPMFVGEWAYADTLAPRYGDAPRCPSCGKFIGMLPWLPPYRVRMLTGVKTSAPGDVVTGPGFESFMASERFVAEFQRSKLKGVERWEPVEIKRYNEQTFKVAILPAPRTRAKLSEMHAVFTRNPPDDPVCCKAPLESYEGVVIDEASWTGDDIFRTTNLGGVLVVTDRFAKFTSAGEFTGIPLVPAETFVPSWARKSPA